MTHENEQFMQRNRNLNQQHDNKVHGQSVLYPKKLSAIMFFLVTLLIAHDAIDASYETKVRASQRDQRVHRNTLCT